jgi:tetratricopeptide (TPR) repeat protein
MADNRAAMTSILEAAETARRKGRVRKAIAGYRRALEIDPNDASIHARLAPLLAKKGRLDEARASFLAAARGEEQRGFLDKAIGLYQGAVRYLPHEAELWSAMAELHVRRERFADAIRVFMDAAPQLRPDQAVPLLQRALELDPYHESLTIALARALRKSGQRKQARRLLEAFLVLHDSRALRAALFRAHPTPVTLWRWLVNS